MVCRLKQRTSSQLGGANDHIHRQREVQLTAVARDGCCVEVQLSIGVLCSCLLSAFFFYLPRIEKPGLCNPWAVTGRWSIISLAGDWL
jgi:hypothetical protein